MTDRRTSRTRYPDAGPTGRRVRGAALVGAGVALLAGLAWQLLGVTAAAWGAVSRPGPARPEDAIGVLTGASALAITAWLALAVVTSALSAALPATVPIVGGLARAVAPRLVRHGVAALIGAVVVGGTAGAASAAVDPGLASRAAASVIADAADPMAPLRSVQDHTAGAAAIEPGWTATSADVSPGWVPTSPGRPRTRVADARVVAPGGTRVGADAAEHVVVRRGDTLWSIAARHLGPGATEAEIAVEWPHWFTANRDVLGRDPDHLTPGQRLRPPGGATHITTGTAPAGATTAGGRR
jgi:nucleoid-associated protein YgaU